PVRRAGRAAGAVAPARRLDPRAGRPIRRADLVLRLDMPAHAPRESLQEARRGSRVLRELHRTLPRLRHLPRRAEPYRVRAPGARRPRRERGDLRFDLPGSTAGSSRTRLRERSSEGASGPGRQPGPESGAPGCDENGTHGRNPWTVRGRAHLPGLRRPAGRRRPDATLPTRAFLRPGARRLLPPAPRGARTIEDPGGHPGDGTGAASLPGARALRTAPAGDPGAGVAGDPGSSLTRDRRARVGRDRRPRIP